jgi:hypothetical protein
LIIKRRFPFALLLMSYLFILMMVDLSCQTGPLLSQVSLLRDTISPNGDNIDDFTVINYTLSRKASLSITLIDPQGKHYSIRSQEARSKGEYSAKLYGNYAPDEQKADRRVMPDGEYTCLVVAEDDHGKSEEVSIGLTIKEADTNPPQVTDVVISPRTISPNEDAVDDEAIISYGLTKEATAGLSVTDEKGNRYLIEAPKEKSAALYSHRWNGTSNEKLLSDGTYTLHIEAYDRAGNITDRQENIVLKGGGLSRLEITSARFYPTTVPVGGILNVEIKVKNTGETELHTVGPVPGTAYDTVYNFMQFTEGGDPQGRPLYYERAGVWRVGVQWDQAASPYPARWGLFEDLNQVLKPGEEKTITGTIEVLIKEVDEVRFWAGVEEGGKGFPGGQVGQTFIRISR